MLNYPGKHIICSTYAPFSSWFQEHGMRIPNDKETFPLYFQASTAGHVASLFAKQCHSPYTLGILRCTYFMSFVDVDVIWLQKPSDVFLKSFADALFCMVALWALRGPVTGCHGKSRYLPSNVSIFNRK